MSCTPQEFHSISFEFKWIVVRYSYNYNRIYGLYSHRKVIYYFYLFYLNFIWAFFSPTSYSIKLAVELPPNTHTQIDVSATIHLNCTPRTSSPRSTALIPIIYYMYICVCTHTLIHVTNYENEMKIWSRLAWRFDFILSAYRRFAPRDIRAYDARSCTAWAQLTSVCAGVKLELSLQWQLHIYTHQYISASMLLLVWSML